MSHLASNQHSLKDMSTGFDLFSHRLISSSQISCKQLIGRTFVLFLHFSYINEHYVRFTIMGDARDTNMNKMDIYFLSEAIQSNGIMIFYAF